MTTPRRGAASAEARENGRDQTPEAPALLSGSALAVFRLNGRFLALAEGLARPAGLSAAGWQVLGAVLNEPLPAAGIARVMGITRQSVQRVADLLVERGLAEYRPNPAHRRAKLLTPTAAGRAAIGRIGPQHAEAAERLAEAVGGAPRLAEILDALTELSEAVRQLPAPHDG
ncbi:MarR family transcriptional regulator [Streptomyces sp. 3MP-14]|uniref:MarR family transcriptional regulator n=1 Tax=Streptomyces mimosae TaxID=2586635 RepID=A0A5N5ZZ39_9ACTN|nr:MULTISPECIES: MarR family transcriptional regulator [Streptomyces]KAB8161757.1 MarR family transcriptional regulator [Streptomyces mimosae]KAB8174975.1 MarR family transcriptional regulator [Streptomyces sp. 3MP-14]